MLTGTESWDTSIIILGVKVRGLLKKDRETYPFADFLTLGNSQHLNKESELGP